METEPTVFIVDEEPMAHQELVATVRSMGWPAEAYGSAAEFLAAFDPLRPGCLLLEAHRPGMDGLTLLGDLMGKEVPLPAVVLSPYPDVPTAVQAMRLGAIDFLEKPCPGERLQEAIEGALQCDAERRPEVVFRIKARRRLRRLTSAERDVLLLLVDGRSNRAIAAELGVSVRTIEVRRAKLMKKMRAASLAELVRMTVAAGAEMCLEAVLEP
jgi:two-component system, LuxR family, response regulator FixJ